MLRNKPSKFFSLLNSFACTRLKTGIYAGTFDPPTSGHLDIINRGTSLCDKLYVGVALNTAKKPIFSLEHRIELLEKITMKHNGVVEVVPVDGLLTDYAKANKIDFFLRGIRSFQDFDHEFTMGIINRRLSNRETVFLQASSSRVHISSTLIRELAMFEKKLDNLIPNEIEQEVYDYLFEYWR